VRIRAVSLAVLVVLFCANFLSAQTQLGSLHGQVTDPSGAVIPSATVTVAGESGTGKTATTDGQGFYDVKELAAGTYTVTAVAKGFSPSAPQSMTIAPGQVQKLNVALEILVQKQEVQVESESGAQVEVTPSSNASSLVMKGKDLEALSDDPDELQSELEALAGPAAGPNGGQIYIDGFTGGQLPPKSAIREIRVNQNPFSAEYDKLGYGRIEILTKPGTDKWHGQFFYNENNEIFNSKNPFAAETPGYSTNFINGRIGGALSKKASFSLDGEFRDINDLGIISSSVTQYLPPDQPTTVPNPRKRWEITPRLDYQLTSTNTLTMRYQFEQHTEDNDGVGGSNPVALASQAYNLRSTENTLQISDTQVLSPKVVNETRLEYQRESTNLGALNNSPAEQVVGVLIAGGNTIGTNRDLQGHWELQNYTSVAHGNHFLKFGGRLRYTSEDNYSTGNFNGTFTFTDVTGYSAGTPSQFSIATGQPDVHSNYLDAEFYGEDDWRLRPNMTLSYGLRYETQNVIHDYKDFAPRVGFAWGLSRNKNTPKTVLRAGFGVFYDRFSQNLMLNAERLNGENQQLIIVDQPNFYPNVPPIDQLLAIGTSSRPTQYRIAPNIRAPYTMQAGIGLERQVTRNATVSVTYLASRGVHQFLSNNINAPLPGTYDPADPASAVYPLGNIGNVYQYESEGLFKQQQLISNFNVRAGQKLSLFGFYTLNFANSNTDGANSFPVDQYNLASNWGRAAFDVRNRGVVGGTFALPYAFRLSPFIFASSGQPFDITYGQDVNGDSIFNDRPVFATGPGPGIIASPYGYINTNPNATGTLVPRNYGTGPGAFTFNARLSKTIGLGKAAEGGGSGGPDGHHGHGPGGIGGRGLGGGGGNPFGGMGATTNKRYSLTFTVAARNLFNNVNLAKPVGNISSAYFDQSLALAGGPFNTAAANRRIDLQVQFTF
jgi:Carboxypeptidase regulatory-like domain